MAMTAGSVLLGKHIKEDQQEIYDEWLEEQKKVKKKGMWSSLGRTLGSFAAPALMGALGIGGGPLGLLAGKMILGRIGAELGERGYNPKMKEIKGTHGFGGSKAKEYSTSIEDALSSLDKTQWTTSIVNPIMEVGAGEVMGQLKEGAGDLMMKYKANKAGEILGKPLSQADIMGSIEGLDLYSPSQVTQMAGDFDPYAFQEMDYSPYYE